MNAKFTPHHHGNKNSKPTYLKMAKLDVMSIARFSYWLDSLVIYVPAGAMVTTRQLRRGKESWYRRIKMILSYDFVEPSPRTTKGN